MRAYDWARAASEVAGYAVRSDEMWATCAVALCFWSPLKESPLTAVGIAVLAAALWVVLGHTSIGADGPEAPPILWIAVSLILVFAGATGEEMDRDRVSSGLPWSLVHAVEFELRGDWRELDRPVAYRCRLHGVRTAEGWSASAAGKVILVAEDSARTASSQEPVLRGRIGVAEGRWNAETGSFYADAVEWAHPQVNDTIPGKIRRWRRTTIGEIDQRIQRLAPETGGLVSALLLGRRDRVATELSAGFRRCGSAHVLALSGMHLSVLVFLLHGLVRTVTSHRQARLVCLFAVSAYLVLTGPLPSLVRAVTAYAVVTVLGLLDVRPRPVVAIMTVVWLVLGVSPHAVWSFSFRLSVAALIGLSLFERPIDDLLVPYLGTLLGSPAAAGYAAMVGSAPIVLSAFGVVYPIGMLVAVPLSICAVAFLVVSIGYVGTAAVPGVGTAFAQLLEVTYSAMEGTIAVFERVPGLRWEDPIHRTLLLGLGFIPVGAVLVHDCNNGSYQPRFGCRDTARTGPTQSYSQETLGPKLPRSQ